MIPARVLCFVVFLIVGTECKMYRGPCPKSSAFRCDNGICIEKYQWCDRSNSCADRSDESYCTVKGVESCNDDIHFKCASGNMCIPIEGYCDGYSNCPDQSDEINCPCEEVFERQGNIQVLAYIDQYRTQQKCWKFSVNDGEYLRLQVSVVLHDRNCKYGNVSIYGYAKNESIAFNEILCPTQQNETFQFYGHIYEKVLFRYRSNYYRSSANSYNDVINMRFQKHDMLCLLPDTFKCNESSCILPEKQCDGNKDCANGRDEENCDYGALSAAYLDLNRRKAARWMRNQHNADWGWKENTQRAVIALYLADETNFNGSSKDDELIAKQLELEVFTYLFRQKFDNVSSSELAAYINALLVICRDPRNFYGYDLISALKENLKTDSAYVPPFVYLTLCNAKEPISEDDVDRLQDILDISSSNHGFILELQALAIMALSCINNNRNLNQNLEVNIIEDLDNLKKEQMEDGSFGNEYTTALVLQALIANNEERAKDWDPKSAMQFLTKKQRSDGSFRDFLTTYLAMPVLNAKSLVDVGRINCTGSLKRPRDGNAVSDIKSRFGKKIFMKYTLYIGDEKDQIHPMLLRTPENITVLELMTLAAALDPKYKFQIQEIKKRKYIYEIYNIPNDPENNRFWFIYQGTNNGTIVISEQSPDKIKAHEKDHIVMWYRTLDSL